VAQLASLIGVSADRIRRIQAQLIQDGLLQRIGIDELPDRTSAISLAEFSRLNLMEITGAGRRTLMGWLGLNSDAALRYHGVFGNGRGSAGRRRRLLRTLRHTIGVNSVFVALAVAAANAKDAGGAEYLAEWRSAAACERRQCKPDGYGCFRRDGRSYGFFLEYDRGTEGRRKYAAKFRAYYRYRNSGQAARDYDGFPTLLFVTIDPLAEGRIAAEARRAASIRGGTPLSILIATVDRIRAHPAGILGAVWVAPLEVTDGRQPVQHFPPGRLPPAARLPDMRQHHAPEWCGVSAALTTAWM
jgi:hypothetical protein